jgi:hypothetical protein
LQFILRCESLMASIIETAVPNGSHFILMSEPA